MRSLFLLLLLSAAMSGCERGQVLARVGGESITNRDLEDLAEINPRLKPRLESPEGKRKILDSYIEQSLLYREANRRGLQRSEQTRKRLALYKKIIIAQAALDDELNKKVQEFYDSHRDEFETVKISHILIRTHETEAAGVNRPKRKRPDADAKTLVEKVAKRIGGGEDFAKIAGELSEDQRTKKEGGSLGELTLRDKRLERRGWLPLTEHAFAMKEGEISAPIQTPEGFHLIKVESGKKVQPLEEAKMAIRFRLQSEVRQGLLAQLKEKYAVKYSEEEVPPDSANPMPFEGQPAGGPETPSTP